MRKRRRTRPQADHRSPRSSAPASIAFASRPRTNTRRLRSTSATPTSSTPNRTTFAASRCPLRRATAQVVPGDYHFGQQWALDNTGQGFLCFPWPFGGELCFYQRHARRRHRCAGGVVDSRGQFRGHRGGDRFRRRLHPSRPGAQLRRRLRLRLPRRRPDGRSRPRHPRGGHHRCGDGQPHRQPGGVGRRRRRRAPRAHPGLQGVPRGRHLRRLRHPAGDRPRGRRRRQRHQHEPGGNGVLAVAGRRRAGGLERRRW